MKKILMCWLFAIVCFNGKAQTQNTFGLKIEGVWVLNREGDERYANYKKFILFQNYKYSFDYFEKKSIKFSGYNDREFIMIINENQFRTLQKNEFDENKIIDFVKLNKNITKSYKYEGKETSFKAVFFRKDSTKIIDASVYSLTFYDENTINLYAFGWAPSQPQEGYFFTRCDVVPNEIRDKIVKIMNNKIFIIKQKTYLCKENGYPSKQYLISGDEVEILEEQGKWLRIRYYGKKEVEGWIKKENVE